MDSEEFLNTSLRPVLHDLALYSDAAEKLLLMTACHESGGFRYRRQVGGPALSYFQMEPNTLDDLYNNYLSYRPERQSQLDAYLPSGAERLEALENNDKYGCAAARFQYCRVPEPLPDAGDEWGLAEYCKKYWNTSEGKATAQKYYGDFQRYKPENYA